MNMHEYIILYMLNKILKQVAVQIEAKSLEGWVMPLRKVKHSIMRGSVVALHTSEYTRPTQGSLPGKTRRENEKYQDWEVPLKNNKWQTDEVAQQCVMQVWILHYQQQPWNTETEAVHQSLVHSIIIFQQRVYGQSALDEYWHAHRWLAFCETHIDHVH